MSFFNSSHKSCSNPNISKLVFREMRVNSSRYIVFVWKFIFWMLLYSLFFLVGLYGSKISVDISWLLGDGWWIPLHVITVIPLVDVSRSFSQHNAEKAGFSFRKTICLITVISFMVSLLSILKLNQPLHICLAALVSVNIGGSIDILIFRFVKKISKRPSFRMLFSNLAATLVGGAAFFSIAYTELLSWLLGLLDYQYQNDTIMSNLVKGWISQSVFIWGSGILIASLIENITDKSRRLIFRLNLT